LNSEGFECDRPVAVPGRTDKNRAANGDTAVTFDNTPVAPVVSTVTTVDSDAASNASA
jgi:hypothetical protein